jgi:predicted Kef-type K+ transport protein
MPHETSLIATIAVSLGFAFVGGFIAIRLRLPPWWATCWRALPCGHLPPAS